MSWLSSFDPHPAPVDGASDGSKVDSSFGRSRLPPSRRPAPYTARPPRSRAAPPSSALRSEDSQPNEGARRSRPWELDAPPSIGASKSKTPRSGSSLGPGAAAGRGPRPPNRPPPRPPNRPPPRPPSRAEPSQSSSARTSIRPVTAQSNLARSRIPPPSERPVESPTGSGHTHPHSGPQGPPPKPAPPAPPSTDTSSQSTRSNETTTKRPPPTRPPITWRNINPDISNPEDKAWVEDRLRAYREREGKEPKVKHIRTELHQHYTNRKRARRALAKEAGGTGPSQPPAPVRSDLPAPGPPLGPPSARAPVSVQSASGGESASNRAIMQDVPPAPAPVPERLPDPTPSPSHQLGPAREESELDTRDSASRDEQAVRVKDESEVEDEDEEEIEVDELESASPRTPLEEVVPSNTSPALHHPPALPRGPGVDVSVDTPPLRPTKYRAGSATLGDLFAVTRNDARPQQAEDVARDLLTSSDDEDTKVVPEALEKRARRSESRKAQTPIDNSLKVATSSSKKAHQSPLPVVKSEAGTSSDEDDVPLCQLNGSSATATLGTLLASAAARRGIGVYPGKEAGADDDDDDDDEYDDVPLMQSRAVDLTEDSDEEIPLWRMRGRSESTAPTSAGLAPPPSSPWGPSAPSAFGSAVSASTLARGSSPAVRSSPSIPSVPLSAKITAISPLVPVPHKSHLSIAFLAPVASKGFDPASDSNPRMRKAAFDTTVAVSKTGTLACLGARMLAPSTLTGEASGTPPQRWLPEFRSMTADAKHYIETVEDVRRLTSKVCGIASSTQQVLGIGAQKQPHQVSLLTADDEGRGHRVYHLEARPHPQGAFALSPFPTTAKDDPTSIDFATGGSDGVVNHWRWSTRGGCHVDRLHTIHGGATVTALEHLAARHNLLVSASLGMVVGFDLRALRLAFSWPTSERVVHLQRSPNPDLVLSTCARRDYDQFRLYDVSGRSGPVSRPVISFGWLNSAQGRTTMGRGCFHPVRRSVFAHGSEDGRVRVWDLRRARDPLLVQQVGDEPVGDVLWKGDGEHATGAGREGQSGEVDDVLLVATAKGVRTVELGIEKR